MIVCTFHTDSGIRVLKSTGQKQRRWLVRLGMKHKDGTISATELRPRLPCLLTSITELAQRSMDDMVVEAGSPCEKAWFTVHLIRK